MTRRRTAVDEQQLSLPLAPVLTEEHRAVIAGYVEPGWQHRAACAGQKGDLWFPDDGDQQARKDAVKVCRTCPVLESCRAVGILGDEAGVWGGATRDERDAMAEQIACGAPPSRVLHRSYRVRIAEAEGVAA